MNNPPKCNEEKQIALLCVEANISSAYLLQRAYDLGYNDGVADTLDLLDDDQEREQTARLFEGRD